MITKDKIEEAKELINDFCMCEYGEKADFSNLSKIPVAYTVTKDKTNEIQVYVDLIGGQIIKEINGKIVEFKMFKNLDELINELEFLDFLEKKRRYCFYW